MRSWVRNTLAGGLLTVGLAVTAAAAEGDVGGDPSPMVRGGRPGAEQPVGIGAVLARGQLVNGLCNFDTAPFAVEINGMAGAGVSWTVSSDCQVVVTGIGGRPPATPAGGGSVPARKGG